MSQCPDLHLLAYPSVRRNRGSILVDLKIIQWRPMKVEVFCLNLVCHFHSSCLLKSQECRKMYDDLYYLTSNFNSSTSPSKLLDCVNFPNLTDSTMSSRKYSSTLSLLFDMFLLSFQVISLFQEGAGLSTDRQCGHYQGGGLQERDGIIRFWHFPHIKLCSWEFFVSACSLF